MLPHVLCSEQNLWKWRSNGKNGEHVRGLGPTEIGKDRPGTVRGPGRPINSKDKSTEKRSERVLEFKEKADMLKSVIEEFAVTRNV